MRNRLKGFSLPLSASEVKCGHVCFNTLPFSLPCILGLRIFPSPGRGKAGKFRNPLNEKSFEGFSVRNVKGNILFYLLRQGSGDEGSANRSPLPPKNPRTPSWSKGFRSLGNPQGYLIAAAFRIIPVPSLRIGAKSRIIKAENTSGGTKHVCFE